MNYPKLHKSLLVLASCALIAAVVGAAFFLDIAPQAGAVVIVLALLWIGWELHRIANLATGFMEGFVEGYVEAVRAKRG